MANNPVMNNDELALFFHFMRMLAPLKARASLDAVRQHIETQAERIAELEIALKVTWIPCEERMPDTHRDVWVAPWWTPLGVTVASWRRGSRVRDLQKQWWVGSQCVSRPSLTHWAEIRWPEPPVSDLDKQITEGGKRRGKVCEHRGTNPAL